MGHSHDDEKDGKMKRKFHKRDCSTPRKRSSHGCLNKPTAQPQQSDIPGTQMTHPLQSIVGNAKVEQLEPVLQPRIAAGCPADAVMMAPNAGEFPGPRMLPASPEAFGTQTAILQVFDTGKTAIPISSAPLTENGPNDRPLRVSPTVPVGLSGTWTPGCVTAKPMPAAVSEQETAKTAIFQMPAYTMISPKSPAKTALPQIPCPPVWSACQTALPDLPQRGGVEGGPKLISATTSRDDYFRISTPQSSNVSEKKKSKNKNARNAEIGSAALWHGVMKKVLHYQFDPSEEDISFTDAMNKVKIHSMELSSKSVTGDGSENLRKKKWTLHKNSKKKYDDGSKFQAHILEAGVNGLAEEFKMLPTKVSPEEIRAFAQNPKKNRYKNVPCLDCSRVKLNGRNEYIHANYVCSLSNPKRFICTQGPLAVTSVDLWHMIAQENVQSIIMLCNVLENGSKKCDEYFPTPENNKKTYDDITVELIKCMDIASADSKWIVISELKMNWPSESRKIMHYRWLDWPDKGVPPSGVTPFRLYHEIKSVNTPIVVHCSAGVGRTGTIVALFIILDHIENGEPCPSTLDVVTKLRHQRYSAIQKVNQYLYLNRILFDHFERRRNIQQSKERQRNQQLQKFIIDYEEFLAKNP